MCESMVLMLQAAMFEANAQQYNSGWQINEVFQINANEVLSVLHNFNGALLNQNLSTKLSIVML